MKQLTIDQMRQEAIEIALSLGNKKLADNIQSLPDEAIVERYFYPWVVDQGDQHETIG
jgi:hypothetical protein